MAPRESAGDRPADGDRGDGEEPEAEEPGEPGVGAVRDRGEGEEEPASDRDQVEDPDEIVGGRVVGALLVVVVEAVELGDDDPGRQAQAEDEQLDLRADHVVLNGLAEDEGGCEESEGQPDEVGDHEHSPHEPAAPQAHPTRAPPLEDVQRPLVEDDRPLTRRRADERPAVLICRVPPGLGRVPHPHVAAFPLP